MTERQPTASFPSRPSDEYPGAIPTPTEAGNTSTSTPSATADGGPLPRPFGRYELRQLLGRGGMGRVYLAHDPQLDRLVALKMPHSATMEGWRERFFAEARAAATFTHPNVCPVYEVGEIDGQPYLTMAFIEGETLAAKLARDGIYSPQVAVDLVCTVARCMHEAHRRGIVHRDLKPANLMLDRHQRPIIMDFGLAIRSLATDDLRLTLTGVALGTPAYMPPEQAGGDHQAIGPPTDVYALGVILYELVTGRVPFKGKSFGKLLSQIERDPPPRPSLFNPQVDAALEAVILKSLAKQPADRFETAGQLANALQRYLEGDRLGLISLSSQPVVLAGLPEAGGHRSPPATTVELRRPRRAWWLAGAAFLLLALGLVASVIYVQTDYGELEVKLSDPNAKVDIRVNGQTVTLHSDGKSYRIKAGPNQKLEVVSPDFETVSESFDVKRGGCTIVQVTLKKKGGPPPLVIPPPSAQIGEIAAAVALAALAAAPRESVVVPPLPFPVQSTLIEIPGWHILTDATQAQMQEWLAARKKDGHSVLWIDAYPIGEKPLFSAVAALDSRQPKWIALFDTPAEGNPLTQLREKINTEMNTPIAMSGYMTPEGVKAVSLWQPVEMRWSIGLADPIRIVKQDFDEMAREGFSARLCRPYLANNMLFCANNCESASRKPSMSWN